MSWNLSLDASRDTGNIHGANDAGVRIGTKLTF